MFIDCYNTKNGVGVGRNVAVSDKVITPIPLSQEGAHVACHLPNPHEVLPHCPFAVERSPNVGDSQCSGKVGIVEGVEMVKGLLACGGMEHETGFKVIRVTRRRI